MSRKRKGKEAVIRSVTPRMRKPRRRALDAVAQMRKGKSLSHAARLAHTTPPTVIKYAGSVIAQKGTGPYKAVGYDRLTREMRFLSHDGVVALPIQSSASASRIAEYWNAVNHYLKTGHATRLNEFRGKTVRVRGGRHRFVTDEAILDRLANAGEVRFEDLYALTAP